ncbi:MAG: hypothetical protein ACTHJH_03890 [Marmoricola sp.]
MRLPLATALPATAVPDLVPALSPGRHRRPERGACFMEMASWLAGEPWSDHPGCTHPVLAELARRINDTVDDTHRHELVPLIPDVIGTATTSPRIPPLVTRACALAVLGVPEGRPHRAAAVALLQAERSLVTLGGPSHLAAESVDALAEDPAAAVWATRFISGHGTAAERRTHVLDDRVALAVVHTSVGALARLTDGDDHLVALLRHAIEECRAHVRPRHPALAG